MEERAQRIVQEAVALAEAGGFEAVKLREVAARSGVALGTVYSRFPSKEAILVAALDSEVAAFEAVLSEYPVAGKSTFERVGFFFEAASLGMFARGGFARAVLRAVGSGERGIADHIIGYQHRIKRLVVAAMRAGEPGSETDGELAFLLQQIWFAELVGWLGGARTEDQVVAHMRRAVQLLLDERHHKEAS